MLKWMGKLHGEKVQTVADDLGRIQPSSEWAPARVTYMGRVRTGLRILETTKKSERGVVNDFLVIQETESP